MLAGKFQKAITGLGMERLEHPLFCHAPVGIRFEIGGEEPIYRAISPGISVEDVSDERGGH